jgi:transposase
MGEALIAGERDPAVLAGLARGKLKATHGALAEALAGRFDDHHAELARMLGDQIDALGGQIGMLTTRIEELGAAIPAAHGVDADGTTGPGAGSGPDAVVLPAVARLDEVPSIGPGTAQVIIAEGRAGHGGLPDSWAAGVVGQAEPPHPPVRGHPPRRQDRQGQPLPQGRAG